MATTAVGGRPKARAHVLAVLCEHGALSRAELARRTALAPSTVSAIVGELTEDGLVADVDGAAAPSASGLGRPATLVALSRSAGVSAGVDFGKRHVRVAVADLAHTVLAERSREVADDLPAAEAITLAVELFGDALGEAGAARKEVVGVGMGLPGPVHDASGELGDSTILPGWVGVRGAEAMERALGLPVELGNDANLGALAEWMWGAARDCDDVVYIKVATGIGSGMVLAGRPFHGAGGTAGELGHTVVEPGGSICRCGNRGCLETVAGAPAILGALREFHGDSLTIRDVVLRVYDGDAGCARAIADAGRAIGAAVATLCNLVNPARVVVGGDVGAAGELLLAPLRDALARGAIRSAADDVEVVQGTLGERAEVLGAIALALRRGAQRLA
jgi:predicted NBD/HSP70 family sugar kinase